jgi:hypothetical protein
MAKNRLHPWMYTTIYTTGTTPAVLLFPPSPHIRSFTWMTWSFAAMEWGLCACCITHGIIVARRLARQERQERQVDEQ